jgi:hypothetical protein
MVGIVTSKTDRAVMAVTLVRISLGPAFLLTNGFAARAAELIEDDPELVAVVGPLLKGGRFGDSPSPPSWPLFCLLGPLTLLAWWRRKRAKL